MDLKLANKTALITGSSKGHWRGRRQETRGGRGVRHHPRPRRGADERCRRIHRDQRRQGLRSSRGPDYKKHFGDSPKRDIQQARLLEHTMIR